MGDRQTEKREEGKTKRRREGSKEEKEKRDSRTLNQQLCLKLDWGDLLLRAWQMKGKLSLERNIRDT